MTLGELYDKLEDHQFNLEENTEDYELHIDINEVKQEVTEIEINDSKKTITLK